MVNDFYTIHITFELLITKRHKDKENGKKKHNSKVSSLYVITRVSSMHFSKNYR